MTDRRRVTHPARPGLPDARHLPQRPTVTVVGGGIAGLAAATGLAERGVAVDLVEREEYLGGRVGGWTDELPDGTAVPMNRGFHAFFRQYYNLRALLRRSDPGLERLTAVDDYPLIDGEGRRDTFRGLPALPPWNAVAFALRSPTFTVRDLLRINGRAAAPLAAVSVPGTYDTLDHLDAASFLEEINFPAAARHLAFEVFSRSFFAEPDELSAAELATMFHIYFLGSSEGLIFDVATGNFDTALWEPLRAHLLGHGARVHTGATVASVERRADGGTRTHLTSGDVLDADAVVLATDIAGLQRIVAASPGLGDEGSGDEGLGGEGLDGEGWRARIAALRIAPPFVVQRLWLDRPVDADRSPFLGTGGLEPLDNVSVVSAYEREAAEWARVHGGSVVELHAYSAADDTDALRARMIERLNGIYPELAGARVLGEIVLHRGDCPQFAPGEFSRRPGVQTPDPAVVLAGDGIRIDLPVALMERAATTGLSAANTLLAGWGIAGHPIHTVPVHGRSPLLRRLAESVRA